MSAVIVLIPAYQPDARLVTLVERLDRHRVLVVDDGSGPAYAAMFEAARRAGAEVIHLSHNRGKGFALKTGFAHVEARYPGAGVVCADSDGQHRVEDVEAVAERVRTSPAAMVLGVRRFTGRVPVRSRFGNAATRIAFRLITGLAVTDTQTGLRGYPARTLPWLNRIPGDRFEYELRLLLRAAAEHLPIEEVDIATVYLDGNSSSHFRPVVDSARIYGPLLAFAGSSLLAFAVDALLLAMLVGWTGDLTAAAIGARLVSATLNYTVNRSAVFGRSAGRIPHRRSAPRYIALAVVMLTANIVLLHLLSAMTGSLAISKVLTEVTLFLTGFAVQRAFVFRGRCPAPGVPSALQPAVFRAVALSRPDK